jgi:hypothetical protein
VLEASHVLSRLSQPRIETFDQSESEIEISNQSESSQGTAFHKIMNIIYDKLACSSYGKCNKMNTSHKRIIQTMPMIFSYTVNPEPCML